jgi:phosphonate transport system substrate-binding protein
MKVELKRQFGVTVESLYVKTASNTFLHVAKGLAAAGGAPDKTFAAQTAALKDALRVIHTTQPLPSHPVAAHPRVASADREKVRQALLDMAAEAAGRELLSKVPMTEAVSASLEEYQAMTGLGLDEYWDPDWKEE